MNDIAILHKAVNNNSSAGSTGMVFEGVMAGENQVSLANENDVPIIVDAIKKGIYCSLHVINGKFEDYVGPILYSRMGSNFALLITSNQDNVTLYTSDIDPFVPNPSPEDPVS